MPRGPRQKAQVFFFRCFLGLFSKMKVLTVVLTWSYRTKRTWKPNVQRKKYYSQVLEQTLQLNFTTHALRCIDKAGGFDNYILNTKTSKLKSRKANELKKLMQKVQGCKQAGMPMEKIKESVFPKPKINCHTYVPRTFFDRFYFDWRGPRKQVIHCWNDSLKWDLVKVEYTSLEWDRAKATCHQY